MGLGPAPVLILHSVLRGLTFLLSSSDLIDIIFIMASGPQFLPEIESKAGIPKTVPKAGILKNVPKAEIPSV